VLPENSTGFQVLFERHPEPMWIYDALTQRFLAVNEAAVEHYGYLRAEFLTMDIAQIRLVEDQEPQSADVARLRPSPPSSDVWRHRRDRRHDGVILDVEITSRPLTYAERPAVLVVARDVSDRVRAATKHDALLAEAQAARRALETQTGQFDAVFEQMADWVVLYGLQGEVLRMNEAARAVFAIDSVPEQSALSGPKLVSRFKPRRDNGEPIGRDDLPMMRVLRGETLTGANAVDIQVGPRRKPVQLNITGVPVRDEAGRVIGAVMVARDVSERRRLEEQAQVGVRELNRRMEEFISIAGHEMRTPLTSILGNIQLAAQWLGHLEPAITTRPVRITELKMLLRRIEGQGRVLNGLVSDLLDASRIHTERLEFRIARFDLLTVVQNVLDEHRARLRGRSIVLDVVPDTAPMVEGDSERIGQVLSNFLSNAHKFSAHGQPITVGVAREGGQVRTWVADGGPGVAIAEQSQIWERFYRIHGLGHQTGSSVGLGLGLYLCRSIIERHHGQVGVENRPGGGAMFWFRLNLATEP
jgi:PAS domain S-box-containing protein